MTNLVGTHDDLEEVDGSNVAGGGRNPYLAASEWGWQIDPDGLRFSLNETLGFTFITVYLKLSRSKTN